MRFLCICQYGHSRSVALTRILHAKGHEAIAMGWMTSPSVFDDLVLWSDKVIIIDLGDLKIPFKDSDKFVDFRSLGPDRWSNPYNQELLGILTTMVAERLGIK